MEFSEKYELLESLTTGAVETFVSNDKLRGCRVLVHILHCDPQRPNQPTVQWVLEGFRKVAPEPVATVLETGRYSGTLYAYVVTKLPDDAALRTWVQRYNAQSTGTHEAQAIDEQPATTVAPPREILPVSLPPEVPSKENAHVPVQFTQMFRTFDSQSKPSTPTPPAPEPPPPASSMPSYSKPEIPAGRPVAPPWELPSPPSGREPRPLPSFSDPDHNSGLQPAPPWQSAAPPKLESELEHSRTFPNFDDPDHPSGLQAAPPWESSAPLNSAPPRKDSPSLEPKKSSGSGFSFTAEFGIKGFPSTENKPPARDNAKASEFTSFFQGPFRPDTPADVPSISSRPIEPQQKPGEFTAMFRPSAGSPAGESSVPNLGTSEFPVKSSPSTGLTGWHTDPGIMSRTPLAPTPPPAMGLPRSGNEAAPVFPAPPKEPVVIAPPPPAPLPLPPTPVAFTPPTPVYPAPTPMPVAPRPSAPTPMPSSSDGATGVFHTRGSEPAAPLEPEPEMGPSPYTQIITVRPRAAQDEGGAEKPAGAKGSGFAAPKLPGLTPPVMPPMAPPPMPKVAAPAPPKGVKAPKAPKVDAPKFEAPPPPPVSYWPLVITLTVIVCLAVILVLYFVLKH